MNKILPIVLVSLSFLVAQTDAEVKQAKEIIKTTGMTQSEARAAAKTQGYTDKQIDATIQKELGAKKQLNTLHLSTQTKQGTRILVNPMNLIQLRKN